MPKLPRGAGKATTKERAKKPAGKTAAAKSTAPAKKSNGAATQQAAGKPAATKPATTRKKAATRSNGGATKPRTAAKPKAAELDFRHRPVDRHEGHDPAGPAAKLTDGQRRLLGDL